MKQSQLLLYLCERMCCLPDKTFHLTGECWTPAYCILAASLTMMVEKEVAYYCFTGAGSSSVQVIARLL
jgi:hypothetical protein